MTAPDITAVRRTAAGVMRHAVRVTLPDRCPVCDADVRDLAARHGVMWTGTACPVTHEDLEEWTRTRGGRVAELLHDREVDEIGDDLLLLDDDLDD